MNYYSYTKIVLGICYSYLHVAKQESTVHACTNKILRSAWDHQLIGIQGLCLLTVRGSITAMGGRTVGNTFIQFNALSSNFQTL